jgi:DHA2 family multidrug resistance protein
VPKKKKNGQRDMGKPLRGGTLVLLTLAIAMATFMEVLDISIVNVSVQTIAGNLGVTPSEGTWAISAYSMSSAVMQPLSGFLARRYGEVRVFLISVSLFIVCSILCGLSGSIQMLVLFRLMQGAVSGPMVPLSQSILLKNYPPEKKGMAMAFWAMTVVVAPIFGPILGGYITDNYSWPWIFFINVPIGVFAFIIAGAILKGRETKIVKVPIDVIGLALLVIGVGCLQFVLDNGNDNDWFSSHMILWLFIVAIVGLMFLIPWELLHDQPVVNLRLFKQRNFTVGVLALAFGMFAFFGSTVALPRWLQDAMGYNATWAGLAVAPVGIFAFLLSPLVGRFSSKIDLRLLTALAFGVFAGASFWASDFSDQASYGAIIAPRLLQGVGVAMFFVPVNQIILSGLPPGDVASASGLANFFRTIASSISTAITTMLYDHRTIFHHARLVENIKDGSPQTSEYLSGLQTLGAQGNSAYAAVDRLITLQANTIALNDILWMFGVVFAAIVFFVWLAKPPFGAAGDAPA